MKTAKSLYLDGSDILEMKVTDCTGRTIEKIKVSCSDGRTLRVAFKSMFDKYSHNFEIIEKANVADVEEVKW